MSMSKSPPEYLVAGEWKGEDTVKMVKIQISSEELDKNLIKSSPFPWLLWQ